MGTELQIEFASKKQMKNFTKWFNKEGFELFVRSKYNPLTKKTDDFASAIVADDEMESGHYIEIQ